MPQTLDQRLYTILSAAYNNGTTTRNTRPAIHAVILMVQHPHLVTDKMVRNVTLIDKDTATAHMPGVDPGKKPQAVKLGKALRQLIIQCNNITWMQPEGFNIDPVVEELVLMIDAEINPKPEELEVVRGDAVAHWYKGQHYSQNEDTGTMATSCIRNGLDIERGMLKLFTEHPDKVGLVIKRSKSSKDHIVARALLWTIDGREAPMMDRVYGTGKMMAAYRKHAVAQGWDYRSTDNKGYEPGVRTHLTMKSGNKYEELFDAYVTVTIGRKGNMPFFKDIGQMPYLDTLAFGNGEALGNHPRAFKDQRYLAEFTGANGGWRDNRDYGMDEVSGLVVPRRDLIQTHDGIMTSPVNAVRSINGQWFLKKEGMITTLEGFILAPAELDDMLRRGLIIKYKDKWCLAKLTYVCSVTGNRYHINTNVPSFDPYTGKIIAKRNIAKCKPEQQYAPVEVAA